VWLHDSFQQAAYRSLSARQRAVLYSKVGKAFLQAIYPMNLKDLLYEVLGLLNKGMDSEDANGRHYIANLNLCKLSTPRTYK